MAFLMRLIQKVINWVVWPIGPQRAKTDEMVEVEDSNTKGIIETNKFTVLELPRSLLPRSLRTNPLSPLSAIPVIPLRRGSDVVEPSLEAVANAVDGLILEAGADNSRGLEDEVANKDITSMTNEEAEEVRVVVGGLDGRTTISRSAIGMRLLISSLTGRCWKRLTSTVSLS